MNYARKQGEVSSLSDSGEHQSSAQNKKYGGFTQEQVEILYSLFRERENEDKMSGKAFISMSLPWVLDGGASHHITSNKNALCNKYKLAAPLLPEGQSVQVEESGMVCAAPGLIQKDVLCTPIFAYNLISVPQLTRDENCIVTYRADFCLI